MPQKKTFDRKARKIGRLEMIVKSFQVCYNHETMTGGKGADPE